ncbi:MAG TPA: SCO family protein [Kofleriaceae bacterium]|nr:SCO family protein [Kofleriaceae bacterium]
MAGVVLLAASAFADPRTVPPPDDTAPAPGTYKANAVAVDEHLGAKLPLDARFRTQTGDHVTLGEIVKGDLPTLLTFNYSDCPMLCSLQLNGLSASLPKLAVPDGAQAGFRAGVQFRIVTIDLEPTESLAKLQKMKDRYIDRLPAELRAQAREGWTFLVAENPGDGVQIRRVADAVGFHYTYLPDRAEWAHPAALIFLSAAAVVTRYVYGIEYDTAMMRESIVKAGIAQASTAVGFMNRCYHYDPGANSHARAGVLSLRIGAAGFLVLLISGLGMLRVVRRKSSST